MLFQYNTLLSGKLIKRPSKHIKSPYIADIIINNNDKNNDETLAHCPSLGVSGLLNTQSYFYVSICDNEKRKSKYTVELLYVPSNKNNYVITNTNPQMGNIIFERLLTQGLLEDFKNFKSYKREKKILDSRFDFYIIKEDDTEEYVEVKSVVLCDFEKNNYPNFVDPEISRLKEYKKAAIFPDGFRKNKNVPISERAIKHIETLSKIKQEQNINTSLYFIVQRDDCDYFKPSYKDQFYTEAIKKNKDFINIKAISVSWNNLGECNFNKELPIII